jgi:hypothetical protein
VLTCRTDEYASAVGAAPAVLRSIAHSGSDRQSLRHISFTRALPQPNADRFSTDQSISTRKEHIGTKLSSSSAPELQAHSIPSTPG